MAQTSFTGYNFDTPTLTENILDKFSYYGGDDKYFFCDRNTSVYGLIRGRVMVVNAVVIGA